jgi:hypothetical protein
MSSTSAVAAGAGASTAHTTNNASSSQSASAVAGAKTLQERLHELITRLAATVELVKNWPESEGDDASIHVETTTKLIASIHAVLASIARVDGIVQTDAALRKNLQDCWIPLDLLDLLDHGGGSNKQDPVGVNPDCFSRALLREALGQLAGLKRRKLALEMLGAAVQKGLHRQIAMAEQQNNTASTINSNASPDTENKKKRKADQVQDTISSSNNENENDDKADTVKEPAAKKLAVEKS